MSFKRAYDRREAALVLALSLAALALGGAWFSELVLGLLPCKLCLWQRIPYYIGIPAGLLASIAFRRPGGEGVARLLSGVMALAFLASIMLGLYHAGVEWALWQGPADCGGAMAKTPGAVEDFFKTLASAKSIRCDEAAGRVLGLSFAGWNALVSVVIAGFAARGASRKM